MTPLESNMSHGCYTAKPARRAAAAPCTTYADADLPRAQHVQRGHAGGDGQRMVQRGEHYPHAHARRARAHDD